MGVGLSGRPPSSSRSQAGSPDRSREAEGSQDQSLMARWPSEALVDPSEEGRVVGVGGTWGEASGWVGVRPSSCDCIIMHHHASSCIIMHQCNCAGCAAGVSPVILLPLWALSGFACGQVPRILASKNQLQSSTGREGGVIGV